MKLPLKQGMIIFQVSWIENIKKQIAYKHLLAITLILFLFFLTLYIFCYPKYLSIKSIKKQIEALSYQIQKQQEIIYKPDIKKVNTNTTKELLWVKQLLEEQKLVVKNIKQVVLPKMSQSVLKLKIQFIAKELEWLNLLQKILATKKILITDMQYQASQQASLDLLIIANKSLVQSKQFIKPSKTKVILCSSEWIQDDIKNYAISIKQY